MQAETRFKKRVYPKLLVIPDSWWLKTQEVVRRGVPDFIGCVGPYFVAIELKTDTGKVDALQEYNLAKIRKAGACSMVMSPGNEESCFEILWDLSERAKIAQNSSPVKSIRHAKPRGKVSGSSLSQGQ